MRRSSLTITLVLVSSPLVLAGCGRSATDRNGNAPPSVGVGFHGGGFFGGFRGRTGSFSSGGFRGGSGAVGHASPGGGFGSFGHAGGAGQ
jgi:hypothetical protein